MFFTRKISRHYKYIDIGIAMIHFEATALHFKLSGGWDLTDKHMSMKLPMNTEYHFSWKL